MAVAKARIARRVVLGTAALAAVWVFGVWPPPIWWRDHAPRCTAMMRLHAPACPRLKWTKLEAVAPIMPRLVIVGEDWRFRTHHGVDFAEIGDALGVEAGRGVWATVRAAWRNRDRLRGASTITQQLAKNLYLSPRRSVLRKAREVLIAFALEDHLSKQRMLELYLNIVEWGDGVFGAEAAARTWFHHPAAALSPSEAVRLAIALPNPITRAPGVRDPELTRKAVRLVRCLRMQGLISAAQERAALDEVGAPDERVLPDREVERAAAATAGPAAEPAAAASPPAPDPAAPRSEGAPPAEPAAPAPAAPGAPAPAAPAPESPPPAVQPATGSAPPPAATTDPAPQPSGSDH